MYILVVCVPVYVCIICSLYTSGVVCLFQTIPACTCLLAPYFLTPHAVKHRQCFSGNFSNEGGGF